MKRIIIALWLVMVGVLSFSSCEKHYSYFSINPPLTGNEGVSSNDINISENTLFPNEDCVYIYSINKPNYSNIRSIIYETTSVDLLVEYDDYYGYNDEYVKIYVDKNTLFYDISFVEAERYMFSDEALDCKISLSEKEIEQIAINEAISHSIDLSIYDSISIGLIEYHSSDDLFTKTIGFEVFFYPVINNNPVFGVSRFNVTIANDGRIVGILNQSHSFVFNSKEKSLNFDDFLGEIESGHYYQMVSDTDSLNRSVLINEIEMGYYVDVIDYSHNNYLLPIYIIRERDNITNEIKYEAIVSAVK